MSLACDFLQGLTKTSIDDFAQNRTIMSFNEYIEDVINFPYKHIKNSAQYFCSMFEYFGKYELKTPTGNLTRYKIFDAEFCNLEGKIFGQEKVQENLVNYIKNFCLLGKVDKFILLHGPNGSAKTSIVAAISRALEYYSKTDEGALYQFSWIFPTKEVQQGQFGFNKPNLLSEKSFAFLLNDELDAIIPCEKRDHPLLILSLKDRENLFSKINLNLQVPEVLRTGELSNKNRQIFDTLLASYHGDLAKVYRHIRVERFYFSKRYRRGIGIVEPQLSVDAGLRQMTSDQSFQALPNNLRHLSLVEIFGPLVEANRGLIEYSDLLKRPLDAWKYLLVASEQASVGVSSICLTLDLIMLASSNELHLAGFKEYPDWPSFKGRMELLRVPYLLKAKDEIGIYQNQITKALTGIHIAPHAIEMAARFAVLTRLEPCNPKNYDPVIENIILSLSPQEKLEIYDQGLLPARLSQKEANLLKSQISNIYNEYQNDTNYEGKIGASPREMMMLLLNAAFDKSYDHLSVNTVFKQIEELIEQKSFYEFLRREPIRGFRDPSFLLDLTKDHYRHILEDEMRTAAGLFSALSYIELFKRYIIHVSAWIKKERLFDPLLQKKIEADEQFMSGVEKNLLATNEAREEFRRQMISQIGAYKLENPDEDLDYNVLFSSYLKRLKETVYQEQFEQVRRILKAFLYSEEGQKPILEDKDYFYALKLKQGLEKLGYNESSAKAAVSYLLNWEKKQNIDKIDQTSFGF